MKHISKAAPDAAVKEKSITLGDGETTQTYHRIVAVDLKEFVVADATTTRQRKQNLWLQETVASIDDSSTNL